MAVDVKPAPTKREGKAGSTIQDTGDLIQLVSFSLADEEFGIDILTVHEINRTVEITRVPESPDFVEGIINLRGQVIPIINLRKRFGLGVAEATKDTRVIVVEVRNRVIGFLVDSVREVLRIPESIIEPAPPIVGGIEKEYIRGVGKLEDRLLILLDLDRVLSDEELQRLKEAA